MERTGKPFAYVPREKGMGDAYMAESLADTIATLEQLVKRITKETDPVTYDLLGAEIWKVLDQLEILRSRVHE
jgi:hypothetical protein